MFVLKLRNSFCLNSFGAKHSRANTSFLDLKILAALSKQLRNNGVKIPTEIQEKAIPYLLTGESAIINSETGSGKTLAYGIPIVETILQQKKFDEKPARPYALVLLPNNELAIQVEHVFKSLRSSNVCFASEFSPLKLKDIDVVISTPSYISTYPLDVFKEVRTIVVDEADIQIARKTGKHGIKDPLFNIIHYFLGKDIIKIKNSSSSKVDGFKNINEHVENISNPLEKENETTSKHFSKTKSNFQLENIIKSEDRDLQNCNKNRQFIFVGATMPDSESRKSKTAIPYIRSWLPEINCIQNSDVHKIVRTSNMKFIDILDGNKTQLLLQMLNEPENIRKKILLFANKVETVNTLYKYLTEDNIDSNQSSNEYLDMLSKFTTNWRGRIFHLHNKISLHERLSIINEYASIKPALLISTDVISRGLDIPNIDLIIQYDFATNAIDVLHRAGRTARMNNQGEVINFITEKDKLLATAFKESIDDDTSLESYFSRNRSLNKRLKRAEASDMGDAV